MRRSPVGDKRAVPTKTIKRHPKGKLGNQSSPPACSTGVAEAPVPVPFRRGRVPAPVRGEGGASQSPALDLNS